jgi:glycosyltransferase involved in cell wall biosynthesis
MRALNHKAVLVAHPEGELYRRASEGPDLVPLAPRNEIDLSTAWKLSRIIRQWKPEVVHAHDPHAVSMAALALSFGAPDPRPPIVVSRRVDFHLQPHSFSRWKHRQVDLFVAASDAIRRVLESDGVPQSRIVVVHDGIDVAKIQRLPALSIHSEFWLPSGVPVVVNVAALVPHKGHKFLIDAMPHVLREMPDAHLIIFGEGELQQALERQIKELHVEKHVLLAGFRQDVLQLMKTADLFAMSSVTEGLGSTLLDAMAMKLAVAGTDAGGIPEAVLHGETGLLAPPGDARALARALSALLRDPACRLALAARGRARAPVAVAFAAVLALGVVESVRVDAAHATDSGRPGWIAPARVAALSAAAPSSCWPTSTVASSSRRTCLPRRRARAACATRSSATAVSGRARRRARRWRGGCERTA